MQTKQGSHIWLKKLNKKQFKRLVGVTLKVFKLMVKVIEEYGSREKGRTQERAIARRQGIDDIQYLREYPSLLRLAVDWGIHESTAQRIVTKTEELLLQSRDFHLPGRKTLKESQWDIVIIDVAETPMERPKKQRSSYSGKKKRHTLKAQVVIDKKGKKILYVLVDKGREHDFKLFKRSSIQFAELSEVLSDRGYQGLQHFHSNSRTPQRKPPKKPLSKEAKRANRKLASLRITVEHVIRDLKIFRILKETYRNKRRQFGLRLHLIAAMCNLTYDR